MAFIVVIVLAFIWLLYETKWMTARLPYGRPIDIREVVPIVVAAAIVILVLKRFLRRKPKRRKIMGSLEAPGGKG